MSKRPVVTSVCKHYGGVPLLESVLSRHRRLDDEFDSAFYRRDLENRDPRGSLCLDGGRKEKKRKYASERDSQVGNVLLSDVNTIRCVPRRGRRATNAFVADQ